MSKPWGNVGTWAEQAEAEEIEQAQAAAAAGKDTQSFPSLKEAVNTKSKKKSNKMSLQEFYGSSGRDSASERKGLTHDEMLRLPTGPKERSAEEMQYGRLGGGFPSYVGRSDGASGGRMRDRDGDSDKSWGGNRRSYGGFDDDRRGPPPRVSEFDQPSRADEVDNWASTKKSLPAFDSARPNRYGSLGGGNEGGGVSRADEVDSWATGKKPIAPRSSDFGSGFRDPGREPDRWTRGGFRDDDQQRREPDRWTRGGSRDEDQQRPRLVLDPPRGEGSVVEQVKSNKPNPFGAARPREEVLAEKGLDWKKMESEIESKKTSRPTSSHSSRPGSAQSSRSESQSLQGIDAQVKPRPKVNPFGDAKPREVLLQEKGLDWRKIDLKLEHRRVDRPETEEEKNLKEEIDLLKKELEKESLSNVNGEKTLEDQAGLHDSILCKERDLEILIRELDDKARFERKELDRPGSGAGRAPGFSERPPSQSGVFDQPRNSGGFMERPRSRGAGDAWTRHGEGRRGGFQGNRDRGFMDNRDMDRPRSRERW